MTGPYYYTRYLRYQSTLSLDKMEFSPRPLSRQNTFDYDDGASNMSPSYNEPDFAMDGAGGSQRLRIGDSIRRSVLFTQLNRGAEKKGREPQSVEERCH